MGKQKIPRDAAWTPVLTLELAAISSPNSSGIGLLISGSSREEVLEKWWPGIRGRISESQLEDLSHTVLKEIHDVILLWSGVQGVLPMV